MFTTAGDTFFTMGDKEGTGVSPTIAGMAAGAGGAITAVARIAAKARAARFMVDSGRTMPGKIPQRHRFYSGPGWGTLCGITHLCREDGRCVFPDAARKQEARARPSGACAGRSDQAALMGAALG